jgi:hypothetical protein
MPSPTYKHETGTVKDGRLTTKATWTHQLFWPIKSKCLTNRLDQSIHLVNQEQWCLRALASCAKMVAQSHFTRLIQQVSANPMCIVQDLWSMYLVMRALQLQALHTLLPKGWNPWV